jgi:hypothetical protein
VIAFMSDSKLEPDYSVEVFVLAPERPGERPQREITHVPAVLRQAGPIALDCAGDSGMGVSRSRRGVQGRESRQSTG